MIWIAKRGGSISGVSSLNMVSSIFSRLGASENIWGFSNLLDSEILCVFVAVVTKTALYQKRWMTVSRDSAGSWGVRAKASWGGRIEVGDGKGIGKVGMLTFLRCRIPRRKTLIFSFVKYLSRRYQPTWWTYSQLFSLSIGTHGDGAYRCIEAEANWAAARLSTAGDSPWAWKAVSSCVLAQYCGPQIVFFPSPNISLNVSFTKLKWKSTTQSQPAGMLPPGIQQGTKQRTRRKLAFLKVIWL